MEQNLTDHGVIVLKFWLQIDKDEQERRFNERMEDPEKQWKITDGATLTFALNISLISFSKRSEGLRVPTWTSTSSVPMLLVPTSTT